MRRRVVAAIALLVASGSLAACGGSESPAEEREARNREEVEEVVERFAAVIDAKNTKAFCALLAPTDKARLSDGNNQGEKRCLVAWAPERNPLFRARGADLSVEEIVKLEPPAAVVRLGNGGRLVLAQENDEWYVSVAPQGKG